jgi:uncharacterized protein
MKKIKDKIRSVISRLLTMEGKPQKVALGYALGIFLATTPFVGLKALIALLITQLCKWKKVAAIIGVYHVNSLTGPFFYAFSFFLGKTVMGYDCSFNFPDHVGFQAILICFAGSKEIFISLLVGGLIIGIPLSFIAYKLVLSVIYKRSHLLSAT